MGEERGGVRGLRATKAVDGLMGFVPVDRDRRGRRCRLGRRRACSVRPRTANAAAVRKKTIAALMRSVLRPRILHLQRRTSVLGSTGVEDPVKGADCTERSGELAPWWTALAER